MLSGRSTAGAVALTVASFCLPLSSIAEEIWTVRDGSTVVSLDRDLLRRLRLEVASPVIPGLTDDGFGMVFPIDPGSTLTFSVERGSIVEFLGGRVLHVEGISIFNRRGKIPFDNLIITQVRGAAAQPFWAIEGPNNHTAGLVFPRVKAGFNTLSETLTIHCPELCVSPALAQALGDPALAGVSLGQVTIQAAAEWVGGSQPQPTIVESPSDGESREPRLCDMTFCQLYQLWQFGRTGDIVGLAVATTAWNIGTADCMWFGIPGEEHPFIIMNLYRLKDDRFEQIGQSWIKHGFYALGYTQCATRACTYEPEHGSGPWLGQGCTDTYTRYNNANQSSMGPRHEVNPWTGEFTYPGSHFSDSHTHDSPIEHRLQVHDADLDPAQNIGAAYYAEGYYCMIDDNNVMNSSSWKPVTVSGVPGDTWTFGMTESGFMPESGFAIKAWSGGVRMSLLAQEIPVVEFVSPDGRCLLGAKATDLGGGMWHYEYALLNVDMDRKVGAFSIPASPTMSITNVGFHAVEHHDEDDMGYSNDPWSAEVDDGAITWSTQDNPVRWGTLYNFRFDADVAPDPGRVTVTLGMFEPGDPEVVIGEATGPCAAADGDMDGDEYTNGADIRAFIAAVADASTAPADLCRGDFDGSGIIDMDDVPGMVSALLAQ